MRRISRPSRLRAPACSGFLALLLVASAVAEPSQPPNHHPKPHPSSKLSRTQQHPAPHHAPAPTPPHPAPKPVPPPAPAPASPAPPPSPPDKGSTTGLPLPRFASLRTDDVNFRAGPGTRYPIEWIYRRRDLPVEIEREFDVWRLVRDPENNRGWVHTATLASRRTLIVTGSTNRILRAAPRDDAAPVAKLEPGVIGRVRACQATADWCQVQVKDYKGWMKREAFWGTKPGEAVQ
jgi:SH3-like domain-containing protein